MGTVLEHAHLGGDDVELLGHPPLRHRATQLALRRYPQQRPRLGRPLQRGAGRRVVPT